MTTPHLHSLMSVGCLAMATSFVQAQVYCPSPADYDIDATFNTGQEPYEVAIADVTADGILDIVAIHFDPGSGITILPGLGDGSFDAPTVLSGHPASGLAVGDLNGDGYNDVAFAEVNNSVVTVRWGSENGLAGGDSFFVSNPRDVAIRDGVLVATRNHGAGAASIRELAINGAEIYTKEFSLSGHPAEDLLVVELPGGITSYVLTNGNLISMSASEDAFFHEYDFDSNVAEIAVGHHNDDGIPDVAVSVAGASNAGVTIFHGNGDGSYTPGPMILLNDSNLADVEITDFNGDGLADIIVIGGGNNSTLSFFPQIDSSSFGPPVHIPIGNWARHLAVADIDGDCNVDVVATSQVDDQLHVLLSNCGSATGACDIGGCCSITSEESCIALGGAYIGDDVECGTDAYFDVQHLAMGVNVVAPSFEQDVNCFGNLERVKWFRFDATFNGQINAQFCHATDYTWFGYSVGDPYPNAVGNCAQCNVIDQGCFDGCKQSHTLGVVAGTSYYFAAYTIVPVEGTFELSGTCDADLAQNYEIGIDDLLVMLSIWGDCVDCQADLNNDDAVDFLDLLTLLGMWGPCGSP